MSEPLMAKLLDFTFLKKKYMQAPSNRAPAHLLSDLRGWFENSVMFVDNALPYRRGYGERLCETLSRACAKNNV
jgi:hypothetical protein